MKLLLFFFCLLQPFFCYGASQLDELIAPEVKNDALYRAIFRIARSEPIKTILEIGSSSGEGSTEAFVKGIRQNRSNPTLYCVEVSKRRFELLQNHYAKDRVKCYNVSSIPLTSFPTVEEVTAFYHSTPTQLNGASLSTVLSWLKGDLDYVAAEGVPQRGIEMIKEENGIDFFDVVLIDGSEFAGAAELDLIYGARFILLDDTNTLKNFANRQRLLKDPRYELVEEDLALRNGYAVFKRKD